MKSILTRLVLPLAVLFAACDSGRGDETSIIDDTGRLITDTLRQVVVVDTLTKGVKVGTGIYSFNANNQLYFVELKEDQTVSLQTHNGKSSSVKDTGRWAVSNGSVVLFIDTTSYGKLEVKQDSLHVVEWNGKPISRTLLQHHEQAKLDTTFRNKHARGSELFALGNEPFWNIEIDNEAKTNFRLADWKEPVVLTTVKPRIVKDSIYYNFGGANKMSVTIYPEYCSDGMSDRAYSNRVRVRFKNNVYTGCGEFVNNKNR